MSYLGINQSPEDIAKQAAVEKKANAIFIASLISILFCCVGGIAASIVANRARNDAAAGNVESAESQLNIALVLMILSFVIGAMSGLGQLLTMR